jgi:hypothetical protein
MGSCGEFSAETGQLQAGMCIVTPSATGAYGQASTSGCIDAIDGGGERDANGVGNMIMVDSGVTGNVLIADQYNNRVIEVTRQGDIVWSFGDGSSAPGPTSIVAPNDAERLPTGETLMSGTGAPAGTEPGCPASGGGCPDNRVIIVNDATRSIVWQYGGSSGEIEAPAAAVLLPTPSGDHVLITDQGNNRILEVDRATKDIVWQFPSAHPTADQILAGPNSAERLVNGNILIADEGGNRIVEVTTDGVIVWQYPSALDTASLNSPAFASRLLSGNTLITDTGNNRIVEVDQDTPSHVVWSYLTGLRSGGGNSLPTRAVRLANGHTLVTEMLDDQVIEIDGTPEQNVIYTHGVLGSARDGINELNQAYDAKVVGDFTGLTPPTM